MQAVQFTEFGPVSNLGLITLPGIKVGAQLGSPWSRNNPNI